MQGILVATSFTLVASIMHTDKLLLDSDLFTTLDLNDVLKQFYGRQQCTPLHCIK